MRQMQEQADRFWAACQARPPALGDDLFHGPRSTAKDGMDFFVKLAHAYHLSAIATANLALASASINKPWARQTSISHCCHTSSGTAGMSRLAISSRVMCVTVLTAPPS